MSRYFFRGADKNHGATAGGVPRSLLQPSPRFISISLLHVRAAHGWSEEMPGGAHAAAAAGGGGSVASSGCKKVVEVEVRGGALEGGAAAALEPLVSGADGCRLVVPPLAVDAGGAVNHEEDAPRLAKKARKRSSGPGAHNPSEHGGAAVVYSLEGGGGSREGGVGDAVQVLLALQQAQTALQVSGATGC
jgi:hypothetical protein